MSEQGESDVPEYVPRDASEANFHYYTSFGPAGKRPMLDKHGIRIHSSDVEGFRKSGILRLIGTSLEEEEGEVKEKPFNFLVETGDKGIANLDVVYNSLATKLNRPKLVEDYQQAVDAGIEPPQDMKWFSIIPPQSPTAANS